MSDYKTYPGREIFPIKAEPACLLKWSWSSIWLETAKTSSCHRTSQDSIDPDNFDNFHNLPSKVKARQDMLDGQWPGRGCEYCKNVETHGGVSDRQMTLSRQHGADKIPPELFVDSTATTVTPTILEIYFNNTCNLSCIYCGPSLSSKWNEEINKFGAIKVDKVTIKSLFRPGNTRYEKMLQDLWKYLETNDRYKVIRHFNFLGGEPLLQKELDDTLEFWKKHPNPSLTFNMISNIMIPHKLFVDKMEKFQKLIQDQCILKVDVTASLDCWGPQQVYVRHGLDLNVWTKNFEYMLNQSGSTMSVHSCITALTIKTMPTLIKKINYWNSLLPSDKFIEHIFDFVIGDENKELGLHPCVFGPGVFDDDFDRILLVMPENNECQRSAKKQMEGLANFVKNSIRDSKKIKNLKLYLDELDNRRNTKWHKLFGWLRNID